MTLAWAARAGGHAASPGRPEPGPPAASTPSQGDSDPDKWVRWQGTRVVNKGAADWLLRRNDLHEPWVFVIGANGKITARFDNVASKAELEAALKGLSARS